MENTIAGISVSNGTFRQQDLLRRFADACELYLSEEQDFSDSTIHEARYFADKLDNEYFDQLPISERTAIYDQASEIIDCLMDDLDGFAAQYDCHFSSHEGDGSDFGFWPNVGGEIDSYYMAVYLQNTLANDNEPIYLV